MAFDAQDRDAQHRQAFAAARRARDRMRFDWSVARIAHLRERWAQGASASTIAKELGPLVTRCAVLGKIHRLGLKQPEFKRHHARKERVRKRRAPRAAATSRRVGVRPPSRLMAAFQALGLEAMFGVPDTGALHQHAGRAFGAPCGLLDLGDATCRWPVGEPGEANFAFCGAAPFERYPYCIGHCLIAYRPDGAERAASSAKPACPDRGFERAA
jgi:GcrA cell cycle regulator